MDERRVQSRLTAEKKVTVVLIDGSLGCLGTVLDLSLSGARIRIGLPIETGRKIDLIFDDHQHRLNCTVIWATDTEVGISFDLDTNRAVPNAAA